MTEDKTPKEEEKSEFDKFLEKKHYTVRQSKERVLHWLMIDGKHYRFERPHPEEATVTSNLIVWDVTKPFSDMFKDRFNGWWIDADPVR